MYEGEGKVKVLDKGWEEEGEGDSGNEKDKKVQGEERREARPREGDGQT